MGHEDTKKASSHVPVARGLDIDITNDAIEYIGWIVQHLEPADKVVVKLYYEPQADGKRLSVRAISEKISIHNRKINQALDRCIGRVAQAMSYPVYKINIEKT